MHIPNIGEVFEGRYELRSLLGQGGFATVYLAWDTRTQRDVVLKLLSPDQDGTYPTTVRARFEREAQIFATLDEPHIVKMYDFGQAAQGLLYMVFEHVSGSDLAGLMRLQKLAPEVVQWIVIQLLEALREAHRHGVLHRDLKPANILLHEYDGDPYCVKLIDFGIAKDIAPDATRLTQTGNVVGTLRYMSPEQIFGEPLTPATDIFCLGMVAFEMVTGHPVIRGSDSQAMLREHATLGVISLAPIPGAPNLHAAIVRALALEPQQRFASADAMLSALRATPVVEHKQGPARVLPQTTPKPTLLTKMAVVVVAVVVAVAALATLTPEEDSASTAPLPSRRSTALTSRLAPPTFPTPPTPTEPEPETEPQQATSKKCTSPAPFGGFGRLGGPGVKLATYIPENYDPEKPPGLVLALHRGFDSGKKLFEYTGIGEYAEKYNWVVVAPDATASVDWGRGTDTGLASIDLALSKLCIDRTKLHILGDEIGVGYAHRIACTIPVSSVVGAFGQGGFNQCKPEPIPYMRIYTKQDVVHPESGNGCMAPLLDFGGWESIENSLRKKQRCPKAHSEPWTPFPDDCSRLTSCPSSLVVCGFDGGHRWPGSGEHPSLYRQQCKRDPETSAPLMDAAAQFMANEGRSLTPDQIAKIDHALGYAATR